METMYYIGLDVHKKTISYCVKDGSGRLGRRFDTRHAIDAGHGDEDASPAVDSGHRTDHLHGLDLRSSQAACRISEGGASADATSNCGG